MKEGLLWYDDDPGRELAEKIGRAARRYKQKFGASPDVCYVHPLTLGGNGNASTKLSAGGKGRKVGQIHVSPSPSVLRHHFWLGREEKAQPRSRRRKAS